MSKRRSREPMPQIVIVTIDESTFTEMNEQWPFARARHAELLMQLAAGKPRLIGIDLIFDAPSSRGPKDDDAFGKAIAFAGNVVLGAAYTKDIQPYTRRETFNVPIPVLRRGAAAVAPVNMHADADGDVRREPLAGGELRALVQAGLEAGASHGRWAVSLHPPAHRTAERLVLLADRDRHGPAAPT